METSWHGSSFHLPARYLAVFKYFPQVLFTLDIFAVIGYAILLAVSDIPGVRYFACYLIAIPLYCGPGLNGVCKSLLILSLERYLLMILQG